MMKATQILIADDHEVIRRGLRGIIESQEGWTVCGEACDGHEAVQLAEKLQPDLAILDITMPRLNGLDATRQVKQVSPKTEVLIFTMHDSEQLVHSVLGAGARGYLLKSGASKHLIPAIKALLNHTPFFSSKVAQLVLERYLAGGKPQDDFTAGRLTAREREVVQLLAEGKSNKEVAAILGITVKTAETHRAMVMRKLELDSFSELVRYAIRNHIIEP
jgi:DNA-binding NarL/FixJ family response regulator